MYKAALVVACVAITAYFAIGTSAAGTAQVSGRAAAIEAALAK